MRVQSQIMKIPKGHWIHTVPFPAKVSPPFSQTHLLEGEQEVNLCVSPRSCLLPLLRLHDIGGQGPYAIHQPLGLLKLSAQTNVDLAAASGAHLGVRRSVCRPITEHQWTTSFLKKKNKSSIITSWLILKYLKHLMMLITERCKEHENAHAKDVHYLYRRYLILSSGQLKKNP